MLRHQYTVANLLRDGQHKLRQAGVESPGLESEILLREALGATREQLFESLQSPARGSAAKTFNRMIDRRCDGTPVAYITGRKAFYRHEFAVDESVLIPRPETEYLVEWSVAWLNRHGGARFTVIDVRTGCGAIGISVALETKGAHTVIGGEVSRDAVRVARENRDRLDAPVELVAGSVLDWCRGPVDLLAVNLPYLRPDQAHAGIAREPAVALYAGEDGFDLNQRLLQQASAVLNRPGGLIMEIDPDQEDLAVASAGHWFDGASVRIEQDLAGLARYLIIER